MRKWLAIDQYGNRVVYESETPRKTLLERVGKKSARNSYRDNADGSARHVGWIVGGSWYDVYLLTPLAEVHNAKVS
jgi:hypothetical protein